MNLKNTLKFIRQTQDQYSIYEVLQYRFVNTKRSYSEEEKRQINDLILSEISLVTRGINRSFEPQKLHLLFQSFFLTQIGDYNSALKSFKDLIGLFEKNKSLWNYPPFPYLYALEGILDSLRSIGLFNEMESYIDRIDKLSQEKYPAYFLSYAQMIGNIFKFAFYLDKDDLELALLLCKQIEPSKDKSYNHFYFEKMMELQLYTGLLYSKINKWKEVNETFNQILVLGKIIDSSIIYRTCRIIYLILKYDRDDDTLQYEERSYKRFIGKNGGFSRLEKLVLKIIRFDPIRKNKNRRLKIWEDVKNELEEIKNNPRERETLKYFSFKTWIENHLGLTAAKRNE